MPIKSKKSTKTEEFSLISREKLLAVYAALLRCKMLESHVARNLPARRTAARTSAAAAVAACIDRLPGDAFAAPARDFLPQFLEGRRLGPILAGLNTSATLQRSRFGTQVRLALARARRYNRKSARRIVVIFGRPASVLNWHALLRTATNERLPIIFVCNGQSHRRSPRPSRFLPAITVDRDDVVALYRVVSEGIAHARRGNGPTLIECFPWSSEGHGEVMDEIRKLESYMAQKNISSARRKAKVTAEFEAELTRRNIPARSQK